MSVKTARHANLFGYKAFSAQAAVQTPTSIVLSTTGLPIVTFYTSSGISYAVYRFTSTGSITTSVASSVDYLYIAGGGGAGSGGGGAGGYFSGTTTLPAGTTSIIIGAGGTGTSTGTPTNGSNTTVGSLTVAIGGGRGGYSGGLAGATGGSGGGAGASNPSSGGAGTAGQGYAGGSCTINSTGAGGGGAAGIAPNTYLTSYWNTGGIPAYSSITGASEAYGRGGNGGAGLASSAYEPYVYTRAFSGDGGNSCNSAVNMASIFNGASGVAILRFIVNY